MGDQFQPGRVNSMYKTQGRQSRKSSASKVKMGRRSLCVTLNLKDTEEPFTLQNCEPAI